MKRFRIWWINRHQLRCARCGRRHSRRYEGTPFACTKALGLPLNVKREN